MFVQMYPSATHFATAGLNTLEENRWYAFSVITDSSASSRYFLEVVRQRVKAVDKWRLVTTHVLSDNSEYKKVEEVLGSSENRAQVALLYCSKSIMLLVARYVRHRNIINALWLWLNRDNERLSDADVQLLPRPFLVINPLEMFQVTELLTMSVTRLSRAVLAWPESPDTLYSETTSARLCYGATRGSQLLLPESFSRSLYRSLTPSPESPLHEDRPYSAHFKVLKMDSSGLRPIDELNSDHVSSSEFPVLMKRYPLWRKLRVATSVVEPFVFVGRFHRSSCITGVVCLQVFSADRHNIAAAFSDYEKHGDGSVLYEIKCCSGLSVDLLSKLSIDVGFDFELFLVADGQFGGKVDGNWTGVIGALVTSAADMACTALSVTAAREEVIDYSPSYYQSSYSFLVSGKPDNKVNLLAFLAPINSIHPQLWLATVLCLNFSAIVMALLEWFGRKLIVANRKHVNKFNLGSALMLNWALLFNNTVDSEIPKLWSSRAISYAWAFVSILVISSYTAHYAALFAASEQRPQFSNIHDTRVS